MNYFDFYGLPETLHPDAALLKQKYYALSKQYHPDFHASESPEKQAEILHLSTLNNKAYQTLSHPDKRLLYVLELHGLMSENQPQELPQSFLMDMMELNEELMDLQLEPEAQRLAAVRQETDALEAALAAEANTLTQVYDSQPDAQRPETLRQLKDYYLKKRYLLRIRETLSKIAAPNS